MNISVVVYYIHTHNASVVHSLRFFKRTLYISVLIYSYTHALIYIFDLVFTVRSGK